MEVINMSIGIYKIENLVNHKVYIGQSKNIERRFREHRYALKHHKHHNPLLQQDYNDGHKFSYQIVEICRVHELNEKEKIWISFYRSNIIGYNYDDGGINDKKYNEHFQSYFKSHSNNPRKIAKARSKYDEGTIRKVKLALYMDMDKHAIAELFHVEYDYVHRLTYRTMHYADRILSQLNNYIKKVRRYG